MLRPIDNNAEYLLRVLEAEGVRACFMVPGKLINPIMSRYRLDRAHTYTLQPIVAAHEAGAAAMADGYARATGHLGVCLAIDGPGAANAIPMLMAAQADGSPVLLLSGCIPSGFQAMGAIQDTAAGGLSTAAMLQTVCNRSLAVTHGETLPRHLRRVLGDMLRASPGTGYLSVAKDVFLQDAAEAPQRLSRRPGRSLDVEGAQRVAEALASARRPIILVGARGATPELHASLQRVAERLDLPVATTISSKSMFPESHSHALGMFGYSGHRRALRSVIEDDPDMILLLGYDATQWTTLAWHEALMQHPNLVQVDADSAVLGQVMPLADSVLGDPSAFMEQLLACSDAFAANRVARRAWLAGRRAIPLHDAPPASQNPGSGIHPASIVRLARQAFPSDAIAVADAGVHRSYAAHYWEAHGFRTFFAATTFAPMGWAVPASIGVQVAKPHQRVVCFTGDGCMLMSGLEIQTAAKLGLRVTFIVFNNGRYGASYFNNVENQKSLTAIPQHDWCQIARGLGVTAWRVGDEPDLSTALSRAARAEGPCLIDVACDGTVRAPAAIYSQTLNTRAFM